MTDSASFDITLRRTPARGVGRFERLPKWLNLVPMVVQWFWLAARYRSFTVPGCANPLITTGGLVGDGKMEYFNSMGALARAATAEHVAIRITSRTRLDDLLQCMKTGGLRFPIVAKPDIGWCGFGVRRIDDAQALDVYLQAFPHRQTLILQRYLEGAGEAGLFHVRHPGQPHGRLIGVVLRQRAQVIGNGRDTLYTLTAHDPRARRALRGTAHTWMHDRHVIPAAGETVQLGTVASTRVGGAYEDGSDWITPALTRRVDAIANDMGEFHVGRFDVRYSSPESLRRGEFTIMEVNGAGSEAVHAWDPRYSIADVYRIVFAKQRLLFAIGDANRRRGRTPAPLMQLIAMHLRQQRLIRRYPPSN